MSVKLTSLVERLNQLLEPTNFKDYSPNGLQVEGCSEVRRLVTGVTASQALIDQAIQRKADALLVHHGYFWKGEPEPLTGMKGRRIKSLMQEGISLLAYHLPLDAHPEVGNNTQLARLLGIEIKGLMDSPSWPLGQHGELPSAVSSDEFKKLLELKLKRKPLHIAGHSRPLRTFAWCTGSAEGGIFRAAELGVDAYISGEISEKTVHEARELGIDYFAAGHHATERYGVKALGEWVAGQTSIEVEFIDIDNPV
ncbi:dinuclear metal center protein, YbgI/SA1388 family [Marinospirillum celere]|uniref:GTP cyclohydrolase 1 type 2 homolog n=1 Tax=Marinospirillum celere TaxID=1122252 RepID=A0A1I1FXI6_9GAMM|nr:Nif3-like dinuclear metal center hexameric protein [Marinospirillum celere]SFC04167.1 dinuclear metal center protein, YbgI/SA1388 family [Marinospirillum celere]